MPPKLKMREPKRIKVSDQSKPIRDAKDDKLIFCQFHEQLPATDLIKRKHPNNRNKHPADQIQRYAKIMIANGVRHPIVISTLSGKITKGHGRLEAALFNGWQKFPVQYQHYENEADEIADLNADNALALWAELDLDGIKEDLKTLGDDFDLDRLGLNLEHVEFVAENQAHPNESIENEIPEVKESICKPGDLWILGNHRLLCGDATSKEDVERLMNGEKADMVYTDPPYGIAFSNKALPRSGLRKNNDFDVIDGDEGPYDPSHLLSQFGYCKEMFIWGANNFAHSLPISTWIVWDRKKTEELDSMLSGDFDLCWSKQKHKMAIIRVVWAGFMGHIKKEDGANKTHPTQKPVKLAERFFERWGKDKANIVDLYLGSGSTLIACEKTNRKCFGMEIDPHYCDIIIARWEKFSGQKAVKEISVQSKRAKNAQKA